jgi:ABC-type phosphate transport system substrate-binding protein
MQVVAALPGSIGYAQIGEASAYSGNGAVAVSIDHRSGHPGDLGRTPSKYQFWTAEYLYTYGQPSPLASAFIAHLTNPAAVSDLTSAGYLPCPPGSSGTAAALCKLAGT